MDPVILILVAAAIGGLGFLLGFLVRMLIGGRAKSTQSPKSKKPAKTPKPPRKSWTEVAHLWLDRQNGRLIFQIENRYYKRGDELTKREREILLKVVMDFYRWLEPSNAERLSAPKPEPHGIFKESQPSEEQVIELPPSETGPDVPQEYLSTPVSETQPPPGIVNSVLSSSISAPETTTPSMVAQVDSILQEKLEAENMQQWAVRLTESPDKGMIVLVGLERYDAIDNVPYKRVRDVIRVSVAEWERRSENSETVL